MSSWSGAATTTSPARVTSPNRGAVSLLNLTAGPDSAHTLAAVRSLSACDADCWKLLPRIHAALRDQWGTLQLGRHFRELAPSVQCGIPELFTRSAGDLLDHGFETDAVKALFGFDAVVGN